MGRRGALGQPPPLPGERGGGKWSRDARYTTLLLLRPRDWGNCSFIEVLGTAGCWASGGTKTKRNKGFSTRPSSGGGSGAVTISRQAVPSISGSPVSGPLALALAAGSGGGLDGLGVLSVTGSTTPHGGRLLPRRGSGGGHRGGAHGDEQAEGLQPEWKQQRVSSGAWCAWSPQSASVLPKTAGHSSRQRRRKGRSVTREHSGTVPSPAPSCQWDTARDGAPGPQAWTSHDPETLRSPSSLGARGPSQHAAHVEPPGRAHPCAGLSVLWPDGPAVTPWRVGQKPPPHRLYKHCQWGLTSTYRPVRGDTVHPAEWKRLLDTIAWPQTAPQRGCPCTPKRLHHRGWWGGRSHKVYFGQ